MLQVKVFLSQRFLFEQQAEVLKGLTYKGDFTPICPFAVSESEQILIVLVHLLCK